MDDIQKVGKRPLGESNPRKIIFFGSFARGEETPDSDVDIMVIEDTVDHQGMEMVRLRKAAGRIAPGVGLSRPCRSSASEGDGECFSRKKATPEPDELLPEVGIHRWYTDPGDYKRRGEIRSLLLHSRSQRLLNRKGLSRKFH